MGCVFTSQNDLIQKNEISLTPLPNSSIRKIRTDSYGIGMEDTNNSKAVINNNEQINNFSSLNLGTIKYKIQFKNEANISIIGEFS